MEHIHCRRIAAATLGCADEHSIALLLDNEEEEAHETPERGSLWTAGGSQWTAGGSLSMACVHNFYLI